MKEIGFEQQTSLLYHEEKIKKYKNSSILSDQSMFSLYVIYLQ
jgi:hypothetical protein